MTDRKGKGSGGGEYVGYRNPPKSGPSRDVRAICAAVPGGRRQLRRVSLVRANLTR